ncbi:MAG: hypothetical protein ACXU86_01675 [Archangium sp.]
MQLLPAEPRLAGFHEMGTTDEAGRVVWQRIPTGDYQVVAATPASRFFRWASEEVRPRGEALVHVLLVFRQVDSLHGQVVDEAGRPLPDAEVRAVPARRGRDDEDNDPALVPQGARPMAQWLGQAGPPPRTGPDGRFTLSGLQRAGWLVTALKEDYALDTRAMGTSFRWLGPQVGVYAIPHPEEGPLRLVLRRGGQVSGRLVGPDGSPVRTFQLNGYDVESPEGRFLWSLESGAETSLTFTAPGLAGTVRRVHGHGAEPVELGDVVLEEGRTVRVRVVDAGNGEPLLSAHVEAVAPDTRSNFEGALLYRPPDDGSYKPSEMEIEEALELRKRREAGGAVTLEHVAEEPLVLVVSAPEHQTVRVPLGAAEQEVTVALHSGARLEGTVLAGGKPLRSGEVNLLNAQGEVLTAFFEGGQYTVSGLEPGHYRIGVWAHVRPPRPLFLSREVDLPAQGVGRLDFEDWRGGASVEVLSEEPVAQVYLLAGHWPMPDTTQRMRELVDLGIPGEEMKTGSPRFPDVPGGDYTLFAVREWHSHLMFVHREEVRLPEAGEVTVRLRPNWQVLP